MAIPSERLIPSEETLNQIRGKAAQDPETPFICKVHRRRHTGAIPDLVASLSGANVEHFVNPELWVPVLCGGGAYLIQAFHPTDGSRSIGGFVTFSVNNTEPKDVDVSQMQKKNKMLP